MYIHTHIKKEQIYAHIKCIYVHIHTQICKLHKQITFLALDKNFFTYEAQAFYMF